MYVELVVAVVALAEALAEALAVLGVDEGSVVVFIYLYKIYVYTAVPHLYHENHIFAEECLISARRCSCVQPCTLCTEQQRDDISGM